VPIYNAVTNTGTEYKGIMKAMTSASIIFTIFVFGGSSYYILRNLDIKSADEKLNKQLSMDKVQEMPARSKKQRPTPESPMVGRSTLGRNVSNSTAPPSLQVSRFVQQQGLVAPNDAEIMCKSSDSAMSYNAVPSPEFIRSENSLA